MPDWRNRTGSDFCGGVREVQYFGELGASGRARMIKIGRRVRDLYNLT